MKTERRQELKTNDLSAFLVEINDWARKYAYQVGAAGGVLGLGLIVVLYVQRSQAGSLETAWQEMLELSFAPETARESFTALDRLIDHADDRDFSMTALLLKASNARGMVTQQDGFHPDFLDDAEQAYRTLLQNYADRTEVAATALSGLAFVEECRFVVDGDVGRHDRARQYLERLQNEAQFKETPYQTAAVERLLSLDDAFKTVTLGPAPPPPSTPIVKPNTNTSNPTAKKTPEQPETPDKSPQSQASDPPADSKSTPAPSTPKESGTQQDAPQDGSGSQP